ncbi:MAG: DUF805 domain-containing protein [Proteobacteria bacterium]|nr:DUF805 domain-containing protein [Pseudomonadota bacterium]
MDWRQFLFGFHGRIRRSEWWLSRLIIVGMAAVGFGAAFGLSALDSAVGKGMPEGEAIFGIAGLAFALLGLVGLGATLWIHLATCVKRLHDQDMTGWLVLVTVIPGIGPLFAFVVMGCLDSQPWTNKHGPSPKPGAAERVAGQFA